MRSLPSRRALRTAALSRKRQTDAVDVFSSGFVRVWRIGRAPLRIHWTTPIGFFLLSAGEVRLGEAQSLRRARLMTAFGAERIADDRALRRGHAVVIASARRHAGDGARYRGAVVEPRRRAACLMGESRQEVRRERADVLSAIAQWGQSQRDDLEAVVQTRLHPSR